MSAGKYPRTFPPDEASSWRRIRRYAVPRWMIKQATERRLAGDWRGACETANVDVTFDLADVANEHGQATATRLEEDLRHFAPDLVRWHLPRYLRGRTTLRPDQRVLLAGSPKRSAPNGGNSSAWSSTATRLTCCACSTPGWTPTSATAASERCCTFSTSSITSSCCRGF